MAKGITAPYGDIYFANTPAIDRLGQQLYNDQKLREARSYQEGQALDAQLQKELGKVRSIDTPDIINAYQQYKQLKKEEYFNKSIRHDPIAFNQLQQASNLAFQKIFSTANKSSELKDLSKNLSSAQLKSPDSFVDDFGIRMSTMMNTPISQLSQPHPEFGDLTNAQTYMDKGITTDFGKMLRDAVGPTKTYYGKPVVMEGGLQTRTPAFEYANTPLQVKDQLLGTMAMKNAGKDAGKLWDQLTDEEVESVIKQYQNLPKSYWENIGLSEPQNLFPKNPDNKAEKFASYLSMKDAISRAPREGKAEINNNLKAVKDLEFDRQKQMEAIKQGNREFNIRLKKNLNPNDTELNNVWYQRHLDNIIADAKETKETHHVYTNKGRSLYYYDLINPDKFTMDAFSRNGNNPDRIGVTSDNKIVPIFFKYSKDSNGNETIERIDKNDPNSPPVIDQDLSKPMSYDQALINLGYRGATKKDLGKQLPKIQGKQTHQENVDIEHLRKKYNYLD